MNSVHSTLLRQLQLLSSCLFHDLPSQSMELARRGLPVRQLLRGRACPDSWARAHFLAWSGKLGCGQQPECLRVLRAVGVGMSVVALCVVSSALQ